MSHVRFELRGAAAVVTLDRPKALHALDLGMVRDLHAIVRNVAADARVHAVVVTSTYEEGKARAFCAGGDVRGVVLDIRDGDGSLSRDFFREEYALNHAIALLDKPWVALLDGIVMGGGAGISVHGSHRVATERTTFAMPETAIGFFPDVGASLFLPRCPGEIGTWLGLTGARLGGHDLALSGLATHVVSSSSLDAIIAALVAGTPPDDALAPYTTAPTPTVLTPETRRVIDRCFAFDRVQDILTALEAEPDVFAAQARATLATMSPTSLVTTLALLRKGRRRTLTDALAAEYRATQLLGKDSDFVEGVRAMLIDKDKQPRWRPPHLADVDEGALQRALG